MSSGRSSRRNETSVARERLSSSTLDRDGEQAYELGAKPCAPSERRRMVELLRDYWLRVNILPYP